jgi:tetratricopeptide (TPR) repeat protein
MVLYGWHGICLGHAGGGGPMPQTPSTEAMLKQADEFLQQGNHEEANKVCNELLKLNHSHDASGCHDMHLAFGEILIRCGSLTKAAEQFKSALVVRPNSWRAHIQLGYVWFTCEQYKDAITEYERAVSIVEGGDRSNIPPRALPFIHFSWGNALVRQGLYEEALQHYTVAIEIPSDYHTYALQNKAECLFIQGKYREAWEIWQTVAEAYAKALTDKQDADYYYYYGNLLYEMFGDRRAEDLLKSGLKKNMNHAGIHQTLVNLYRERAENDIGQRAAYRWSALHHYKQAKTELEIHKQDDPYLLLRLADLCLSMEEYDQADAYLSEAIRKGQDTERVHTALGVLFTRRGNWTEAKNHFELASHRNPADLKIRSNLAEVLLKMGDRERAESEFRSILTSAPGHLESRVGLGEVYKEMGDADNDEDKYAAALHHFSKALDTAARKEGSKRFHRRELAAIHYSMGYIRAKLYGISIRTRHRSILRQAARDFRNALEDHSKDYKAERSLQQVKEELNQRALYRGSEGLGSVLVTALALLVFALVQAGFFLGMNGVSISVGYYVLLTFGSLLFMIAGLTLPQLLKLKVGTVELEKRSVEQVDTQISFSLEK